jgi:predicted DNA-binding WGR domain protein
VRRWEFVGGKSEKFWEVGLDGTAVTSRYGRIGTNGQTTVKEFDSATKAESYLQRVIAEKEKKGYSEVAESPQSAIPETVQKAPEAPKDEETFELPGSWRRVLHPRHGGIPRPPAAVDKDAVREVAHWVRECAEFFRQILNAPGTDPQLAKEAQAHLDGHETPRGAALIGEMAALKLSTDRSRFADAWMAEHGLVFAARALAELAEVTVEWNPARHRGSAPSIRIRPAGEPLGSPPAVRPARPARLRADGGGAGRLPPHPVRERRRADHPAAGDAAAWLGGR